jgi:hypothetical protein
MPKGFKQGWKQVKREIHIKKQNNGSK